MAVMNLVIVTGTDDGDGFSAGSFGQTDLVLFFGNDGDSSWIYLRFLLTDSLAGATIDSAILTGRLDGGAATTEVDVYADDSDDPVAPTTWAELIAITGTTASVKWTVTDLGAGDQSPPDIKAVIQELVDTYPMVSGDAITIIIEGDAYGVTAAREMHSFESVTFTEPRLDITFTAAPQETGEFGKIIDLDSREFTRVVR